MSEQERDPRVNPRPGDRLKKDVVRITITAIRSDLVGYRQRGFGREEFTLSLRHFMEWAASAEVIKKGDQGE